MKTKGLPVWTLPVAILVVVILIALYQAVVGPENPIPFPVPVSSVNAAPSAYELESAFCARSGEVWDEVNHTCVPSYVLKDRVTNQPAPTEPGCELELMGTSGKGKSRRDISVLGGLRAQDRALFLTTVSDEPMVLAYFDGQGYATMYSDHPDTTVSVPAHAGDPVLLVRHCGGGLFMLEFVYDGGTWWQLVPNPLEDVEITIDTSTTPQVARGCVTMVWTLVDEIVVRTQTTGDGETFVASVPGLPGGYHELTESQAVHAYKTAEGGTTYDTVAWASQNTYLQAGQNNIVRIDSWLPDEELANICSK